MLEDDVRPLVDRYESIAPDGIRVALWYDGDEYDLVYARDDVREVYSPEEFEEKIKQLVVEGLGDPPSQEQFRLFGEMNAVVRQFEHAVMVHFPVDEFTGVAVTFDADTAPSLDTLVDVGIDHLSSSSAVQ